MNASIAARLAERARAHPERTALVEYRSGRRESVSYAELTALARGFAAQLARRDVAPGDRVVLFVPVSIALYVALVGVFHAGAVAVFVDPGMGRGRVEAAARRAGARAFAGTTFAQLVRLLSPTLRAIPVAVRVPRSVRALGDAFAGGGAAESRPAPAEVASDHPALLTFTTGSTGRPKATLRTHGFLWTQHEVLARHLEVQGGGVDLPTLPVFVLHDLAQGATAVLCGIEPRRPERIDPARVAAQIAAERVATAVASPAVAERLVDGAAARGATLPLRRLDTGGAPITPALAARLARGVEGDVVLLYGSTEAEPIASITARAMLEAHAEPGLSALSGLCAGQPVPEIDLRIVRATDAPLEPGAAGIASLEVPPGEAGEIVVAGAHVLPGYWDDPESDRRFKLHDGGRVWHRTGDGGRLDAAGRLWLLGRVRERIERGGATWWGLTAEIAALAALEGEGASHAAYLAAGERAVMCLEGPRRAWPAWTLERVRRAIAPAPLDEVRPMEKIPRDPRHHSKTDTERLRRRLSI
jgi:acyl-CoA synthetase (AMP-forming)/AMP-acid ligase II